MLIEQMLRLVGSAITGIVTGLIVLLLVALALLGLATLGEFPKFGLACLFGVVWFLAAAVGNKDKK